MNAFKKLLGDGGQWGIAFEYIVQKPSIAEAFLIAEDFIGLSSVVLMLGDNIFSGGSDIPSEIKLFNSGATIFSYHDTNPQDYAVISFDSYGRTASIDEKPQKPNSNYVVTGAYIYDNTVIAKAKTLLPSIRGELEITDINKRYLEAGELNICRLSRGYAWMDAGTSQGLQEASIYIETIEKRQGIKIGCPEEASCSRLYFDK